MKSSLGPVWNDTAVLIATEFGRTVHVNGTYGTDHGTATVAFLLGGAVAGKRVIADWPGLKQSFTRAHLKPDDPPAQHFQGRRDGPSRGAGKGPVVQRLPGFRCGETAVRPAESLISRATGEGAIQRSPPCKNGGH